MSAPLTISDVDAETMQRLEAEARRRGVDVNVLARDLLQQGLPPNTPASANGPFHDLDFLAGSWSEADAAEFETATADFQKIDPELWK
jgi:hypothetical protein